MPSRISSRRASASRSFVAFWDPIICASRFAAMPWVKRKTCGLSFFGRNNKSCKAQFLRHESNHVGEGDLDLDSGPSTRDSCLFLS